MPTLTEYLENPCASLSIPWWKQQRITLPEGMHILHGCDYCAQEWPGYQDEPYFRLIHRLQNLRPNIPEGVTLRTAAAEDYPVMAELINRSYSDLSVTVKQLADMAASPAYAPEMWLMALDQNGIPLACAIAACDPISREGSLEWIQAPPKHRRKGICRAMVMELLVRMAACADFVTVSGKAASAQAERFYRSCGFTGDDVWHILLPKEKSI